MKNKALKITAAVVSLLLLGQGLAVATNTYRPAEDTVRLGIRHFSAGNLNTAKELSEETIQKNPKLDEAYQLKGRILLEREKYKEAEKQFKKAVELNPHNKPSYYFDLLRSLLAQNKTEPAKEVIANFEKIYTPEIIQFFESKQKSFSRRTGGKAKFEKVEYIEKIHNIKKELQL